MIAAARSVPTLPRLLKMTTTRQQQTSRHNGNVYRSSSKAWLVVTAAFSARAGAFAPHPHFQGRSLTLPSTAIPTVPSSQYCQRQISARLPSRRYLSSSNNNNDGLFGTLSKAAKKVLPSSWFASEQEKQAAIQRRKVRDDMNTGISELLKGAPLPVRMLGRMAGPLISSAVSGLAETMAEQQELVTVVLDEARAYLAADPAVATVLGDGAIQVGAPVSQSSSTSSINGQTTSRVDLTFPVQGSRGTGMAQATSVNGQLQSLVLQAGGGRPVSVSLRSKVPRSSAFGNSFGSGGGSNNGYDDDIIEAEIIDKNTRN